MTDRSAWSSRSARPRWRACSSIPGAGSPFVAFLAFEFTVVTALSLFTELLPQARATMMSSIGASSSLGRVAGALIGGPLWALGGLPATATASVALTGLALACLASTLRSVSAGAGLASGGQPAPDTDRTRV
jgi:predicted MFS family arabinose efflux permease